MSDGRVTFRWIIAHFQYIIWPMGDKKGTETVLLHQRTGRM